MKKRSVLRGFGFVLAATLTAPAMAAVMVGGAAMYPSRNIIQNAVHSKEHTTLVSAVKEPAWFKLSKAKAPSPCSRRPTAPSTSSRTVPSQT